MTMPPNWVGIFCTQESLGKALFAMDPETFLGFLSGRRHAPYLVAGAVFDLMMNDQVERAQELAFLALEQWPGEPWEVLPGAAALAQAITHEDDRPVLVMAIRNALGALFKGKTTIMGGEPPEEERGWRKIFDTTLEDLKAADVETIVLRHSDVTGGAYLLAGLIIDVFLNEEINQACDLTEAAHNAGMNGPWEALFGIYVLGEELRRTHGNDAAGNNATSEAIRALVEDLFGE